MQLNMNDTMRQNITNSDFIFIVATTRLKERADEIIPPDKEPNNLQFELNHIFNTKQDRIIPLIYEGTFNTSIPTKNTFSKNLCYDFSNNDYVTNVKLLIGIAKPKGIISIICDIKDMKMYELYINEILSST